MMLPRFLLVSALAFGLSACATAYQPEGWTGGFSETPLAADAYQIHVKGNAYTSSAKTNAIAIVRAAELTLQHGYKRFIIMDFDQWTKTTTQYTSGSATTTTTGSATANTYGSTTYVSGSATSNTIYTPPTAYNIDKPRTDLVVRFVGENDVMAAKALVAEAMILQYGPKAGYKTEE